MRVFGISLIVLFLLGQTIIPTLGILIYASPASFKPLLDRLNETLNRIANHRIFVRKNNIRRVS